MPSLIRLKYSGHIFLVISFFISFVISLVISFVLLSRFCRCFFIEGQLNCVQLSISLFGSSSSCSISSIEWKEPDSMPSSVGLTGSSVSASPTIAKWTLLYMFESSFM